MSNERLTPPVYPQSSISTCINTHILSVYATIETLIVMEQFHILPIGGKKNQTCPSILMLTYMYAHENTYIHKMYGVGEMAP